MSKRSMDMQGGAERYGGSNGPETPEDTPQRATAAQLARRKIASVKSRSARSTSPTKLGPLFSNPDQSQQPNSTQPPQSGFSFGAPPAQNGKSNGFSFGQPQPSANGSFPFGQSQPSTSNTFTFGQGAPTQSGGFSFNAGSSSMSFPPANTNNPFTSTNGQSATNGFSGSIFNLPSANSSQSQPTTNGFSFGSNTTSTAPTSPASSQENEAEKRDIREREPFLNSAQQKQLEDMVSTHLLSSPNLYQSDPLDMLPSNVLGQTAQFMRSLPSPPSGASRNVMNLFVKPYRGKSQKPWVSDADRQSFQSIAQTLAPDQQVKLAEFVKDNVGPLKGKANGDLPGIECLPNDVQYEMLQVAKGFQQAQGPVQARTPAFQRTESSNDDVPHVEETDSTPAKPNPFAAIKAPTPASSPFRAAPAFSFSAGPTQKTNETEAATPNFSFAKPSQPTENDQAAKKSKESSQDDAEQEEAPKTNPFQFLAKTNQNSAISNESTSVVETPQTSNTASKSSNEAGSGGTSFKFGAASSQLSTQFATPTKPTFSFGQTSKTPAAPSANIFSLGASAQQPPATAPVQKTIPPFSFGGASALSSKPARPSLQPPQQQAAPSLHNSSPQTTTEPPTASAPDENVDKPNRSRLIALVRRVGELNEGYRANLARYGLYTDWTDAAKFYVYEMEKLKKQIREEEAAEARSIKNMSSAPTPAATPAATPAQPTQTAPISKQSHNSHVAEATPGRSAKPTGGFQLPPSQKPFTATASIFSNILDAPDTPTSTTGSEPMKSDVQPTQSSPFKFQPSGSKSSATPTPPASQTYQPRNGAMQVVSSLETPKAPTFSVPKFGGSGASSGGFMSAFGAQARKESDKEKNKRKLEDFDSDEDDEDEWERKDREEQEAKKQKLSEQAKKVMKNVGGKFVWVDVDTSAETPASKSPSSSELESQQLSAQSAHGSSTFSPQVNGSSQESQSPARPGASLFDRIGKNQDGSLERDTNATPAAKPTFSFGNSSPAGDQTWKPETPIKFGGSKDELSSTTPAGSPAKPLFSFTTQTNGIASNQPMATPKFTFGKPADSASPSKGPDTTVRPMPTPKFSFGTPAAATAKDTEVGSNKSFAGLFPSTNGTTQVPSTSGLFSGLGKPANEAGDKPSVGFKFGAPTSSNSLGSNTTSIFATSNPASRATTPGTGTADEGSTAANTDNEGADAPGDAAPPEEQRDLTALSAEEQRTEDVLFEAKARCRKFNRSSDQPWENKGVGIIRLLKNKESGVARTLMRLAPGGQIVINANLMKDKSMYSATGEKAVKMVFAEGAGELGTYSLSFGKKESVEDLLGSIGDVLE